MRLSIIMYGSECDTTVIDRICDTTVIDRMRSVHDIFIKIDYSRCYN